MLDIRKLGFAVADSHCQRTMPFRRMEKPIRLPGGNFSPRFQIVVVIPTYTAAAAAAAIQLYTELAYSSWTATITGSAPTA